MKVEDKFNIEGIAEQMFQEMKEDGEGFDLFDHYWNRIEMNFAEAAGRRAVPDKGLYLMAFIDFCGKCMHQCPSPEFEYVPRPIEQFQGRTGCKTRS